MATDNGARLPVPKSSGGPEESKEERPLLIDLNMEATREVTEEGHQTSVEKQGKAATNVSGCFSEHFISSFGCEFTGSQYLFDVHADVEVGHLCRLLLRICLRGMFEN